MYCIPYILCFLFFSLWEGGAYLIFLALKGALIRRVRLFEGSANLSIYGNYPLIWPRVMGDRSKLPRLRRDILDQPWDLWACFLEEHLTFYTLPACLAVVVQCPYAGLPDSRIRRDRFQYQTSKVRQTRCILGDHWGACHM